MKLWGHKLILPWHKLNWWQLLSNAFPTQEKLNSLFHIDDVLCSICNPDIENVVHLLFSCDFSRRFWLASLWNLKTEMIACHTLVEGLQFLWFVEARDNETTNSNKRNIVLFSLVLFDLLWKYRNAITHGSPTASSISLLKSISSTNDDIMESFPSPKARVPSAWTPFPSDWIKINLDVAVLNSEAAIACVARNSSGFVIRWAAKRVNISSPLIAEGFAANLAVDMADDAHWCNVIFTSDSQIIVEAINASNNPAPWIVASTIDNFLFKLSSMTCWSFLFTPICCNFMAHNPTKWCLLFGLYSFDDTVLPPTVFSNIVEWCML
ncbi:hypothetical protein UlMin_034580 [Ulmus minor]